MLNKIVTWFRADSATRPSLYQEAIRRWTGMKAPTHAVFQDIRLIEVPYVSIEIYFQELQRLQNALDEDKLYVPIVVVEMQAVQRQRFYTDSKNCYLDPGDYHRRFVSLAVSVLEEYERKTLLKDPTGLIQANLYRALPVINNLITLSEGLNP